MQGKPTLIEQLNILDGESQAWSEYYEYNMECVSAAAARLATYEAALREIADSHSSCIGVPIDTEACSFFANTVNHVQEIARKALEDK